MDNKTYTIAMNIDRELGKNERLKCGGKDKDNNLELCGTHRLIARNITPYGATCDLGEKGSNGSHYNDLL